MTADNATPQPITIQKLATAVYPSFAMLAGMQLDVFTPLKDGSMTAESHTDTNPTHTASKGISTC